MAAKALAVDFSGLSVNRLVTVLFSLLSIQNQDMGKNLDNPNPLRYGRLPCLAL